MVRLAETFCFDDIRVDVAAHRVEKGGVECTFEPKVFAVLLELLAHPAELMTRDHLLDAVWGHRHVTPGVLNRAIATLRKVLGDDVTEPRYIETVHGLGYRFVGALQSAANMSRAVSTRPMTHDTNADLLRRRHDDSASSELRENATRRRFGQRGLFAALTTIVIMGVLAWSPWWRHAPRADPVAPAAVPVGLAVLPFSARGGDAELVAAAEGLSESLTDAFARNASLHVAGRESVFALGRGRVKPQRVAEVLNVDYVLSGEAEATPASIEVRIALWRRGEAAPVWLDNETTPRDQLFRLVVPLIERVRGSLLPQQAAAMNTVASAVALPAEDLYWLGRRYWYQRTPTSLAQALGYFQRAVATDPKYALGYTGIADAYMLLYEYADTPLDEAITKARSAIARAKELAPDLADAYASEGLMLLDAADAESSVSVLERALQLEPQLPNARLWYGDALAYSGRVREALAWHKKVEIEDPLNPILQTYLGVDAMLGGDQAKSTLYLRRALELDATYPEPYWQLALQHTFYGRLADAQAIFDEARSKQGANDWTSVYGAYIDLLRGDADGAARKIDDADNLAKLDRFEPLAWTRWLQGRSSDLRVNVENVAVGAGSARFRDALLARIDLLDGHEAAARAEFDRVFAANVERGDTLFRPWLPDLGLGYFTAWIALLPPEGPMRARALDAYTAQLTRFVDGGMHVPALTYQLALLAALRGDATAAKQMLNTAMSEGWLDVSALRRDPGWRRYAQTAWLKAAQQQLTQRAAASRVAMDSAAMPEIEHDAQRSTQ
jgi:DNA-binding winged helix-turn-helix (wHTH) protein/TolB-like protein/Tfp pilus assembly protein PilF